MNMYFKYISNNRTYSILQDIRKHSLLKLVLDFVQSCYEHL